MAKLNNIVGLRYGCLPIPMNKEERPILEFHKKMMPTTMPQRKQIFMYFFAN